MGCCDSKSDYAGAAPLAHSGAGGLGRAVAAGRGAKNEVGVDGGRVMDQEAPQSTAKPLSLDDEAVRRLMHAITDIYIGEKEEIDQRVPRDEVTLRRRYYKEMVLHVRGMTHTLCEGDGVELGVSLVPSQVADLLREARALASREISEPASGGDLHVPQHESASRAEESGSFDFRADKRRKFSLWTKRRHLMRGWLVRVMRGKYPEPKLPTEEARELAAKLDMRVPPRYLREHATGGVISYPSFLDSHRAARAAALRPLRELFAASCGDFKFMDAATFGAWHSRHFGAAAADALSNAPLESPRMDASTVTFPTSGRLQQRGARQAADGRRSGATSAALHHARLRQDGLDDIQNAWTVREFVSFVSDPKRNPALQPRHCSEVYMDMNRPLYDYYICSSHNSWLSTAERLTGDSCPETLKQLLLQGCRYIELDCHDGVSSGEPEVYLAWSKSGRVKLRDCLEAIAESAFTTNQYPVILALELHFGTRSDSTKQMAAVATLLTSTLGDRLARWEQAADGGSHQVPPDPATVTPQALLGKVLVKTQKRAQEMPSRHADPAGGNAAGRVSPSTGVTKAVSTPTTGMQRESPRPALDLQHPGDSDIGCIGVCVVDIRCRKAVKVTQLAPGGAASRAGIVVGSYIEAVTRQGEATVPVRSKEDLVAVLDRCRPGNEIRVRANQEDHRVILDVPDAGGVDDVLTPLGSPSHNSGLFAGAGDAERARVRQSAFRRRSSLRGSYRPITTRAGSDHAVPVPDAAAAANGAATSDDDSDDGLPDVQRRWRREQIDTWEQQGVQYQRLPVVQAVSVLAYLVPRRRPRLHKEAGFSQLFAESPVQFPSADYGEGTSPWPSESPFPLGLGSDQWWEVLTLPQAAAEKAWSTPQAARAVTERCRTALAHSVPRRDALLSENYNPLQPWLLGIQFVAMNFQCSDAHMLTYLSKFADNGRCGYVLKPPQLRSGGRASYGDPTTRVTVTVMCGLQLYRESCCDGAAGFAPRVSASVSGVCAPGAAPQGSDNYPPAASPPAPDCDWDHTWSFDLRCPSMATLRLSVTAACGADGKESSIGEVALPCHLLIPGGPRAVRVSCGLPDDDGGILLCRFGVEEIGEGAD